MQSSDPGLKSQLSLCVFEKELSNTEPPPPQLTMGVSRELPSVVHEDSREGLQVYLIIVVITDFETVFVVILLYLMAPAGPVLNSWSLTPAEHLVPLLLTQSSSRQEADPT